MAEKNWELWNYKKFLSVLSLGAATLIGISLGYSLKQKNFKAKEEVIVKSRSNLGSQFQVYEAPKQFTENTLAIFLAGGIRFFSFFFLI